MRLRVRPLVWLVFSIYAIVLVADHRTRSAPSLPPVPAGERLEVPVAVGERWGEGTVSVRVLDRGPRTASALVLLHGSPGSAHDFDGLVSVWGGRRRTVAIDLPGFGASSLRAPDLSIRAHARTVAEVLDRLGVERAHVLGFSLGGGVALELVRQGRVEVASVVLLSSIGVQELELFGNYSINHALHRAQWLAFVLIDELVPHFGRATAIVRARAYAQNFVQSDQRPLRSVLEKLSVPTLILHGRRDFLVPVDAALEHARLVPQARWRIFEDGSHFLPWTHTLPVANEVSRFLDDVDAGRAPTRATAEASRIAAATAPFEGVAPAVRTLPALLGGAVFLFAMGVIIRTWVWPLRNAEGRRLLRGRWMRLRHWEYWPSAWVYPPIVWRLLWKSRRHGGLLSLTTTNPGIEASGFVGESKSRILASFGDDPHIARFERIARGPLVDRLERVEAFRRRTAVDWPIVLKPDAGQRGEGVVVVRDAERLREVLASSDVELLAQEYVPGREWGVLYIREPGRARGRLFSVAEKVPPVVVGDGVHDLRWWILHDRRALPLARRHLRMHAAELDRVLAEGEAFVLSEIGTHSLGAMFVDANHLRTPALEEAIDRLSRRFRGFHLGRYDLRAPDEAAMREGRDFKVLELNGLTSEAAHAYDPRYGYRRAVEIWTEQWETALRIGAANRAAGHTVTGWATLARAWWSHRERRRRHYDVLGA